MDSHFAFITETVSRASAIRWRNQLLDRLSTLADHPEQHPVTGDAEELGSEVREVLAGRRKHVYRVLFTIDGDVVNIHRIRHAAQDRLEADDL